MYSWINQNKIDTVLVAGLAYNFCVAQCKSVLDKLQRYLSFEYFVVSGCTANLYTDTTNGKKISIFKPVNKIDTKKFIDIEMIK
jgi:nicotinamidase-related amidase